MEINSTMKTRVKHIVMILTLLLMGSMVNEAWAANVRYHILTLPFSVRNYNNTGNYKENIRVEALLVVSDAATIGLPEQYKSPLATNFQYYTGWNTVEYTYLYDYTHNNSLLSVKYYLYSGDGSGQVSEGADASSYTDIYVTYTTTSYNEILLDGTQDYNITVGGNKFLCLNRSRNNRPANVNTGALTGENLVSLDFVVPPEGTGTNQIGFKWSTDQYAGAKGVYMGLWLVGSDPYNVTLKTAYIGNGTYHKDPLLGQQYYKPYQDATIFSKIVSNNDNARASDDKMWFASEHNRRYRGTNEEDWNTTEKIDEWPGFFRQMQPTFNSVAILNHPKGNGNLVFVASKINQGNGNNPYKEWAPNAKGNYATLSNDNNNPVLYFKSLANSPVINIYKIRTYTIKIKTHGSVGPVHTFTMDMRWSDARASDKIVDHIPETLKRKYCSYKAYSDEGLTNEISTFDDAKTNITEEGGKRVIWLDYNVTESFPFETLPKGGCYVNARWYTMRMNGKAEPKNIAYNSSNNFITGATSIGNNSNLHTGENSADAQVAFIGDPYELKIISRAASEAATKTAGAPAVAAHNRYVGATSATDGTGLNTNMDGSSGIFTWEMVYESADMGNFVLRQFNTVDAPKYVGWDEGSANKPVVYSTAAYTDKNRIRVVPLEEVTYTYHIVRNNDGDIAVKASSKHDVGKMLRSWTDIPEIIRSPYLSTATVTYYATVADAKANTNAITNAPYDSKRDIYVRYSFAPAPTAGTYNVILNNDYIYTSGSDVVSTGSITSAEADTNPYKWLLNYSDPYAMTIKNLGTGKYVKFSSWSDNTAITWVESETDASRFVAKSGALDRTYEVMAATGDGTDASVTYYNIGRPAANTVKLYSNSSYLSGNATLRFQLISTTAMDVTYHLIDKAGKDLLQARTRQATDQAPAFPPEFHSPLVSAYHYYLVSNFTPSGSGANMTYTLNGTPGEVSTVNGNPDIYVTYDVNDLVDLKQGQLYLLKYEAGQLFRQENGSDDLLADPALFDGDAAVKTARYKAVYPYCNGDCNFFVYGQEQYDIQQRGAASTRTRWAWYVQSDADGRGDPYHVKIMSRQIETYNSRDNNAYFSTYKPEGYSEVVTSLTWPGINGTSYPPLTEYMVLGTEGQYQLVTTYGIDLNNDGDRDDEGENVRYTVNSFEQYWKTFDTIRKKIYGDNIANSDADPADPDIVPDNVYYNLSDPTEQTLRNYLETNLGWHSYAKWAYAKRWDGCNNADPPAKSKGWEKIEHWFQTVNMGEGYFDFVKTSIDPVLILLDQHGWEIVRKPLPSSPDDPEKDAKYEAIRPYNSPMVKEYAFWSSASKRTGYHQYYKLNNRIGGSYTSTDLTKLPSYDSKNVKDNKGNLNDQYVTYIVKDEYAQTYNPTTKDGKEFLIEQGTKYASTSDGSTISKNALPEGGIPKRILDAEVTEAEMWYLKPNANIDKEMGYPEPAPSWGSNPNAYTQSPYKDWLVADYIDDSTLGKFSFSNGFDPYNIQITPKQYASVKMKTNATGATLDEGYMHGDYTADPAVSLGAEESVDAIWYDNCHLKMTNATWMAVQDADGNMQLMPRFDHDRRMSEFGTLIEPTDANVTSTYTKLYRPVVYKYRIIDNSGNEALRYKGGGDLHPQTPEWFKSPLAKDFEYYTAISGSTGSGKITGSLDGVSLTDYTIYVRYRYDEDADVLGILKGNWLTMTLSGKNAVYNTDLMKAGSDKPDPVGVSHKDWQWKFTATPQTEPDPYAVSLYNRSTSAGTSTAINTKTRFALLNYYHDGIDPGKYTLAVAGTELDTYDFVNGSAMTSSDAATTSTESGVKNASCSYDGTGAQVILSDDVVHTFTYKVYTNHGVLAIEASQTQDQVSSNSWIPELPGEARTPLLDVNQYRYYEQAIASTLVAGSTPNNPLSTLYGLYEDVVYTHYTPYSEDETDYMVPNVKTKIGGKVARSSSSNDAPLGLNGTRPYNIIWYDDNMMKANGTAITCEANQDLKSLVAYEWVFEGEDPYAIRIRSKSTTTGDYVHQVEATPTTTDLNDTPTTFMLLNRDGYDYGVFATTGKKDVMLSGYGHLLVTDDHDDATTEDNPTKFVIFALSTNKVIYHLMIKNIGTPVVIPYKATIGGTLQENYRIKSGTTMRDLLTRNGTGSSSEHTDGDEYQLGVSLRSIGNALGNKGIFGYDKQNDSIYCYDAGHVSLGDELEVPLVLYRPNVHYDYYIEGVYANDGTGGTGTEADEITKMNGLYKGVKVTKLGEDSELLDKIILVNIVYSFQGGLDTNSGSDFVTNVNQNKWYTLETSDATPKLAQFTNAWGLRLLDGRESHYTNDYLWSPVGDPYGFKFYNRYIYKTDNESSKVLTASIGNDATFSMDIPANNNGNDIYELLSGDTPGYFKIHPMKNKEATKYYFNNVGGTVKLKTTATEFTFGLSEVLMRPYYERAGYVGGLTPDGKTDYEEALAKSDDYERLMALQDVVYGHDARNIVPYSPGYYRLHSSISPSGIKEERYASGYTHKTEMTYSGGIPIHLYEKEGERTTFEILKSGFTKSDATRGPIPISAVEYDPASIFYFPGNTPNATGHPLTTMSTQGLNVNQNKMTTGAGTTFCVMDIGGAVFLIHDNAAATSRMYFNYDQTSNVYDLKFSHNIPTDDARWCLQPVQKSATAGTNEMGLRVRINDGGDDHYYATFCAPFDVLLTDAEKDEAYIVPSDGWPTIEAPSTAGIAKSKKIGLYNTADNECPASYRGSNQFIPAGVPAIIRSTSTNGYVTMALPTTTPSTNVLTHLSGTALSGKYLEQMLDHGSDYVYAFGLPSRGTFTPDVNFATNGELTAELNTPESKGVGFFKNANPNKEASEYASGWTLNNKYVYANKVYYRAPAPAPTRGIDFIPVIFGDDAEDNGFSTGVSGIKEDGNEEAGRGYDNRVYDLQGRCVATEEQVKDGTWKNNLTPGVYIMSGKKIIVK